MKFIWGLFDKVILVIIGVCIGGYLMAHKYCKMLNESEKELDKQKYWVRLYDIWMLLKQSSVSIEEYLLNQNITNIAIYGASFLGIRLYYELKNSKVRVKYLLDKNPAIYRKDIEVKNPKANSYEDVDIVIVTALYTYDEIKVLLMEKGCKQVKAFDEILYEMMREKIKT